MTSELRSALPGFRLRHSLTSDRSLAPQPSSVLVGRTYLWLTSFLTRAPLGYSAERAPPRWGGGGADSAPCLTPELIGAARRRSKALNEKIPMYFDFFFKRSHVRSRSGQRSEIYVFGLLPIETGLSTVERPNSPKTLLYSRREV